jgi:hypothetical protein
MEVSKFTMDKLPTFYAKPSQEPLLKMSAAELGFHNKWRKKIW